jgi:hypothetical protein
MSTGGGGNKDFWEAHASGLAALVKLRPVPNPHQALQFRIFQYVNTQMLTTCLRYGRPSYLPFELLQHFYNSEFPIVRLTGYMHQGVDLLAQWRQAAASMTNMGPIEIKSLLNRIILLDAELAQWEMSVPLFFTYGVSLDPHTGQPYWMKSLLAHAGAPPLMHCYESFQNAYGWNLYRALRILLNRTILDSVSTFPLYTHSIELDLKTCLLIVKKLVEDICASVLSILIGYIPGKPPAVSEQDICGFRAHGLVSALELARACLRAAVGDPESQLRADWVGSVLSFIAKKIHCGGR